MFKLKEIQLYNHPMFEDKISLVDEGEENQKNYISLVIGSNGTGKSQLLKIITDIFIKLNQLHHSKKKSFEFDFDFKCKYILHKIEFEITSKEGDLNILKNGSIIDREELRLPQSVLVLPYNFNDRFPFFDRPNIREEDPENNYYRYLGLRTASNNIFTSGSAKKVIDFFSLLIESDKKFGDLIPLFKLLNFSPKLEIYHKTGRNYNFLTKKEYLVSPSFNYEDFKEEFTGFMERKSKEVTRRFNEQKLQNTINNKEKIDNLLRFLRQNPSIMKKKSDSGKILKELTLDLLDNNSISKFSKDALAYQTLRDLDIFTFDRIDIQKGGRNISMDKISSGEYHLLFSVIALFVTITPDSLVLIDEPEISLHPNWQMKYLNILEKSVIKNTDSHFIISSHSHLLVSDLNCEKSTILGLNSLANGTTQITKIAKNTFGWSVEQILLEIFEVPTTRNIFLADEIGKIIKSLSQKKHTKKQRENLNKRIDWLRQLDLNLKAVDPLKEVVKVITN